MRLSESEEPSIENVLRVAQNEDNTVSIILNKNENDYFLTVNDSQNDDGSWTRAEATFESTPQGNASKFLHQGSHGASSFKNIKTTGFLSIGKKDKKVSSLYDIPTITPAGISMGSGHLIPDSYGQLKVDILSEAEFDLLQLSSELEPRVCNPTVF